MNTLTFCVAGLMILSSGLLVNACQPGNGLEEMNVVHFGEEVALSAGQPLRFTAKGNKAENDLILNLHKIVESRCPEGLNCITAGNASVELLVMNDKTSPQSINMCLGDCVDQNQNRRYLETDTAAVQVGAKTFTIILKAVNPYPSSDNTQPENQEAVVIVVPVR